MHRADPDAPRPWPPGSFLHRLAPQSRVLMLGLGTECHYTTGEVLMWERQRSTFVVVIRSGLVKVTAFAGRGREALLAIRGDGDIVGELASMDGAPRSASVTACSAVEGRRVSRPELQSFLQNHPDASAAVTCVVAERLRAANRRRTDFVGCKITVRLARILLELDQRYGRDAARGRVIEMALSQFELASLAGVAEVTVHRPLRELREAGLIETGRRQFRIRDPQGLRAFAQGS